MPRILFVAGQALGHVGRVLTIARAARAADCKVDVCVPERSPFAFLVHQEGMKLHAVQCGDVPSLQIRRFAEGLEALIARRGPDAFCYDANLVSWLAAFRFPPIPCFFVSNLVQTRLVDGARAIDAAFARRGAAINQQRETRGLPPLTSPHEMYADHTVLLMDPPQLLSGYQLPGNFAACGPASWEACTRSPPPRLPGGSRLLLFSMGSTGRLGIGRATVEALMEALGCDRSVYAGSRAAELRGTLAIDECHEWLPINALLPRTVLVVCQGGAGSTYQALAGGVPAWVVPSHPTQRLLGEEIRAAGLGWCSDPEAIERDIPSFSAAYPAMRRAVGTLAHSCKDMDGPRLAVETILKRVQEGAMA